jgi:hypothetical protein
VASEVSVCNEALILIGAQTITSLEDDNNRATTCNAVFADTRDEVLRSHPWRFAVRRTDLGAPLTAGPEFQYSHAFTLPVDPFCLRALNVNGRNTNWAVEGRVLMADVSTVKLRYIARIPGPGAWDAMFASALAARIASKIGWALTRDRQVTKVAMELYMTLRDDARAVTAQEGSPEVIDDSALDDVRGGGFETALIGRNVD